MLTYFKNVTHIDVDKIDLQRGLRQGLLMFLPLLYGLMFHDFSSALLATIGTFASIYVFKGTFNSRLRSVTFAAIGLVVTMMIGTLTASTPLLFGIFLLIVAVVPFYVFNTLNIPGPSSTFFIIAYSLASVMPPDPHAFLWRGAIVGIGGLLALIFVLIEIKIGHEQPEFSAVSKEFKEIQALIHHFNEQVTFNALTKTTVQTLISTSEILQTSRSVLKRKSVEVQRLSLLHRTAEGVYSELLELNAKGHRPIPPIINEMMTDVVHRITQRQTSKNVWRKEVNVPTAFEELVGLIFKVDEMIDAPDEQVKKHVTRQSPQYIRRLRYHLTPESMHFISAVKYSVIIGIAIFVALIFNFERAYWIPLSAHTVLLGGTTIASIERAGARWIGTLIGIGIVIGFLLLEPNSLMVVIVLSLSGAITEILVGANYALAMFAITVQVILLGGLAQGSLTFAIAIPRLLDTTVGVGLAIIGVMIIGRRLASKRLPEFMADVTRIEARIFHTLFSNVHYNVEYFRQREKLRLKINIENMQVMYRYAYGELLSNKKRTQYFYPAMFILEQMSFKLMQVMEIQKRMLISEEAMGQYLVVFENIAKLLEQGQRPEKVVTLPEMNHYAQLRRSLMQLQEIELYDYQNVRNPHLLKD
ncbi:FUSC family protein [Staphylococcus pseudintermedius]|uniref:FUSC family protein n=1 Tax=Staphylococcus pseudintermedius TaxID=283734 RepID=UPI00111E5976|nr:FUSC family protein [Staphylococcus pseudintermedius]EJG1270529.1 FUSC family protein [Staphylococcus pseudintermedius]EKO0830830.1 FUSC family protein [Staphylococcus pseudintermedius]EKO8578861.1 FUSC family protein [Staphylococcus pseudintermedius]TOZ61573.1 FUSC family protein [Staphylococcus pseudintermedius]HCA7531484.1 FUSC family protein [Staphylococcus pseudintermedius]